MSRPGRSRSERPGERGSELRLGRGRTLSNSSTRQSGNLIAVPASSVDSPVRRPSRPGGRDGEMGSFGAFQGDGRARPSSSSALGANGFVRRFDPARRRNRDLAVPGFARTA